MTDISPRRTVTEADIVAFAGLSGDYNALHTDEVSAAASSFGRRVAHGLLGTAIASGLFTRTALAHAIEPHLIALAGVEVGFHAPIFAGDTLELRATVTGLRATSDQERWLLTVERLLVNQREQTIQRIVTSILLRGPE